MKSPSSVLLLPMVLIVASNVVYQVAQRTIPPNANPVLSLLVSYFTAILVTLLAWPAFRGPEPLAEAIRKLNFSTIAVGIAIVGIEFGFLLVYRSGWPVSSAALTSGVTLSLLLLPVGLVFFRESWSLAKTAGVVLCLSGLYLLHRP